MKIPVLKGNIVKIILAKKNIINTCKNSSYANNKHIKQAIADEEREVRVYNAIFNALNGDDGLIDGIIRDTLP